MKELNMYRKKISVFGINFELVSNILDFVNGKLEIKLKEKFEENFIVLKDKQQNIDFYCYIIDDNNPLKFMIKDNTLFLRGPFSELEKKFGEVHSILRYFIYNYVLLCLEKKLKIYNIHASSVIDKKTNKVFMFVGHAGSGKTTCLLAAVEKGLMILGNDLSSIKEENKKYIIFPTSAFSPINNKTLSKFKKIKNITENVNKFYEKTPINLNIFKYRSKILNPKLTIIFPHIIEDSKVTILPCKNKRKAASEIYEQITNRIRNTSLLYYSLPIPSLDNEEQMNKRAEFVKNLIDSAETIIYVRGDAQKIIDKII